ncbi:TetR/AcrR family transcriptional regulator [Methylobacterium durans]|uniref:TetR/AcrR family transcriptional regulator n=1 Tax=Methylobacterium durans TaxID=2202825 RepID=UPI002AFE9952|nr:TetR/AcrR family transcriptional regulator [Methylobacterium durans]MEA1831270.1 TetR/AcrR family transcriptional regulator [Methylobacterium durans]
MTAIMSHRSKGRPRSFDREHALHRALEVFWKRGYEPATMGELCAAMGINPPSLYAAFGNKASLFMEAVEHYETTYWAAPWRKLDEEPSLRAAMERFLLDAAAVLSSLDAPCGCMVVLATANVSPEAQDVHDAMKALREVSRANFLRRFEHAIAAGDLPSGTDVSALAAVFTTVLQGMSVQARDGAQREELERIARASLAMLP